MINQIRKKLWKMLKKTSNRKTNFKLRCPRYVYTLKVDDRKKADKIKT